jgi:hypothetical protein
MDASAASEATRRTSIARTPAVAADPAATSAVSLASGQRAVRPDKNMTASPRLAPAVTAKATASIGDRATGAGRKVGPKYECHRNAPGL